MSFSWAEILRGMISAAVYGGFFALLISFAKTCIAIAEDALSGLKSVFVYSGKLFLVEADFRPHSESGSPLDGEILRAFLVILYTVGFCVASYVGIDGEVRMYTLLISLCAFYLTKSIVGLTFERLISVLFRIFLRITIPALRLVFYPARRIFLFILSKMRKNALIMKLYSAFCHNLILDNSDKKC